MECTVNRVHDRWFDQIARTGHDARAGDLSRFAELGIHALRYPVLWERLAPHTLDHIDWRWSDDRLARLKSLGVRPIVGLLHHGSGPEYTSLVDPAFPTLFARFARAVAARYPWVTDFTPVNEPLTTARFSGLYGYWYPHGRDDRTFVRTFLTQMRAIVLGMRAIRQVTPAARLVQTEDCGRAFGTPATAWQVTFEEERRWLTCDLLTGKVDIEHPLYATLLGAGATAAEVAFFAENPCPPAVIGLNYYLTSDRFLDERLDRYPIRTHGGNDVLAYADVEAVRGRDEGIAGHEAHLVDAWERYRLPVAVTEIHLGCTREEQVRWLLEASRGAQAARARGAEVIAITAWALLGAFDWNSLVTVDAGEYEPGAFDVSSGTPRPTAVARAVRSLASGVEPTQPSFHGAGWWHRPERLIHGPASPPTAEQPSGPPILVFGRTGTLGHGFERGCSERGLRAYLASRFDADITDPIAVDALMRRVKPWAVINAAGYVRVDDAETDREACWDANVRGPVTLAAACRRRGVPLVVFSSDLVFDGRAQRPYLEDDIPGPLSVYGHSKAEMETRVAEILPAALVIRTSAFFGPWDRHNFLACMMRAVDGSQRFHAPMDATVSPTYVPHLAHAALDLLLDGEQGIWHLANQGAVTWFEFAQMAAGVSRAGDICAARTASLRLPAERPPYSALGTKRGAVMPSLREGVMAWLRARPHPPLPRETVLCESP